jgi:hypothetical protein
MIGQNLKLLAKQPVQPTEKQFANPQVKVSAIEHTPLQRQAADHSGLARVACP